MIRERTAEEYVARKIKEDRELAAIQYRQRREEEDGADWEEKDRIREIIREKTKGQRDEREESPEEVQRGIDLTGRLLKERAEEEEAYRQEYEYRRQNGLWFER